MRYVMSHRRADFVGGKSMGDSKARPGDKARFHISNTMVVFGELVHTPKTISDSWIVQTYLDGQKDVVWYIRAFNSMILYPQNR